MEGTFGATQRRNVVIAVAIAPACGPHRMVAKRGSLAVLLLTD